MGNKRTGFISSRRIYGQTMFFGTKLTGSDQDYEEASAVQNYEIGAKMLKSDGRVFYYAKAGGTLNPNFGCKFVYPQAVMNAAMAAALVGALQVVITVGAGDGILSNGAIVANELVNGWMVVYTVGGVNRQVRKILANTAVLAGGGAMTVTLDRPLTIALGGGATGECMHSVYANVQTGGASFNVPVVGVANCAATINQYLWLQTWGPTFSLRRRPRRQPSASAG